MKNSLHPTGTSEAVLRPTQLVLAAILAGSMATGCGPQTPVGPQAPFGRQTQPAPQGAPAPPEAQSSLVGQWRTMVSSGTITITFMASGQYDQTGMTTTGTQTMQAGPYQLVAPNNIIFTVTIWSPKTRIVLVPCGIPNDPVCNVQREVAMPQPPNSEYAYVFNGPNTVVLTNQTGTLTFTRVTAQ